MKLPLSTLTYTGPWPLKPCRQSPEVQAEVAAASLAAAKQVGENDRRAATEYVAGTRTEPLTAGF